jgi:ABC-type Mn2+/Zn2+ transport system ATPase subunit
MNPELMSPVLIFPEPSAKKIGVLSGGKEIAFNCITLKSEANVLLLDEPTNDLDVITIRALEEGLRISEVVLLSSILIVGFSIASQIILAFEVFSVIFLTVTIHIMKRIDEFVSH